MADHQRFSDIANCLVEGGAQAIAVACTDLSVMGHDGLISDVPLIDALDVLTEAIVTCVEQLVQFPERDSIQGVQ
jgi:aspartate/glutamate racemase